MSSPALFAAAPAKRQEITPPSDEQAMFSYRAKRRFKQHFVERLLNGEDSEHAADHALEQTKREMLNLLSKDVSFSDPSKRRLWMVTLEDLVDWQILLSNLPIDLSQKEALKRITEGSDIVPDIGEMDDPPSNPRSSS